MRSVSDANPCATPGGMKTPQTVVLGDVEGLGGPLRRRALPQIVQHDPGPTPWAQPVVRLVQVVVQSDHGAGGLDPIGCPAPSPVPGGTRSDGRSRRSGPARRRGPGSTVHTSAMIPDSAMVATGGRAYSGLGAPLGADPAAARPGRIGVSRRRRAGGTVRVLAIWWYRTDRRRPRRGWPEAALRRDLSGSS